MKNKAQNEPTNQIIFIKGPHIETDEHGLKDLFTKLNQWARCPNDNSFLVYKDEKKETAVCPKCGFEKSVEPVPNWP